jgi:hypothetical protein
LCGLTEDEVAAIAEHEHVPEIAATNLACYLLHRHHGPEYIRNMIVDDIRTALREKETKHAAELFSTLRHFLSEYPAAGPMWAKQAKPLAPDQSSGSDPR